VGGIISEWAPCPGISNQMAEIYLFGLFGFVFEAAEGGDKVFAHGK
jgi:hypothetical protein